MNTKYLTIQESKALDIFYTVNSEMYINLNSQF